VRTRHKDSYQNKAPGGPLVREGKKRAGQRGVHAGPCFEKREKRKGKKKEKAPVTKTGKFQLGTEELG